MLAHGIFEQDILNDVADDISMELKLPVEIQEGHTDLNAYYDSVRRQYNGNGLLKEVNALEYPDGYKKIGLFRVDLFIPILTFIFGQAIYKGNSGIVSTYRLKNEQYGMKPDDNI